MIRGNAIRLAPVTAVDSEPVTAIGFVEWTFTDRLRRLWDEGKAQDKDFEQLTAVVQRGNRVFLADLASLVKVSVADCTVDTNGYL